MSVYCNNCFSVQQFDDNIPNEGIKLKCANCGYKYILYPSKVMIGNFQDFLFYHHNSTLSYRALNILKQNIPSVEEFWKLGEKDFSRFRNCGLKISSELLNFREILQKELGYTSSSQNKVVKTQLTNAKEKEIKHRGFLQ